MKRNLFLSLLVCLCAGNAIHAQNADQLYFNQLTPEHDYVAASFVVDTPPPASNFRRAFLLWSRNYSPDTTAQFLSLDELDPGGNFLTEHVNRHFNVLTQNLIPKKIIKAQSFNGYYLLGYVINSGNTVDTFHLHSTPVVIKIDSALNPVWVGKLHYNIISPNTVNALIEYNDITEAANGELILAGRFSYYYTGQPTYVLATRLKNNGGIIWNYMYTSSPTCNAEALSLTEAKDGNIALTGYIENCSSPAAARQLLYMLLKNNGNPILEEALTNNQIVSGDKIVRHVDPGGDAFFISGYIDVPTVTGAPNRQILIADIKEAGSIISVYHIGDAGTDVANDLIFHYNGGSDFDLYLTGFTTGYDNNVKSDVYYLQMKYNGLSMSLVDFSVFPRPNGNYVARSGVEIKKAGKERYAILANAQYLLNVSPVQQRVFTNVLVRDLNDVSGSCIKRYEPPVKRYELDIKQLAPRPVSLPFKLYRENYKRFEKISPKLECGQFFIDAANAATVPGNPDQTARRATATPAAAIVAATARAYPNPVKDKLYIDYAPAANEQVSVKVYSLGMQLLHEQHVQGSSTITVPVSRLASGVYFVRVEGKSGAQSFKIKKE